MMHGKSNKADMPRKMPSQSKKKRMMKDKAVPMSPKFVTTPEDMDKIRNRKVKF